MGISLERNDGEWYKYLPQSGGVYDLINAAVYGTRPVERLRAVVALGKSGDPRAVRPLVDLLGDPDTAIRLASITALGNLKSGRPVEELIERLRDQGEQTVIRKEAAVTLSAIRSTGALRGLREFVADESEDPQLRSYTGNLLQDAGIS
ncbi:MAG TPA: HEAT repeat domain-containing protein [Methanoregula sp.]|nr:HEAT repeat domain-containing protein [Methanoregula sp.]